MFFAFHQVSCFNTCLLYFFRPYQSALVVRKQKICFLCAYIFTNIGQHRFKVTDKKLFYCITGVLWSIFLDIIDINDFHKGISYDLLYGENFVLKFTLKI